MLSAIILAKNESDVIERCLRSVQFCDEIIVIDDESTDKTVLLSKQHKAKVYTRALNNDFAAQRNFALSKATHDWVLFIDSDEQVSQELAGEIKKHINTTTKEVAFYLRRRDFFWGQELKYGETQTARNKGIMRLVNKNKGLWQGVVHEEWEPKGQTATMEYYLNHYPHPTIVSFLHSINHYSSLRAQELSKAHVKQRVLLIFFNPIGKFLYTYFFKRGFLDGPAGFVYSFMMSFHSFLVRSKLYVHQQAGIPLTA